MLSTRGVRSGDRVLIVSENNAATVALFFAVQVLEAWPSIVNARVPWREIEQMHDTVDARCIVFATDDAPAAADHARANAAEWAVDPDIGNFAIGPVRSGAGPEPVSTDPASQPAAMIFTSGTTGVPKAVMLSHDALIYLAERLATSRGIVPGDLFSAVTPLSHIVGLANVLSSFWSGAGLHIMPRLEVPALAEVIADGGMTHFAGVPAVLARLADHAERANIDFSRNKLRHISCGGAPLDAGLKARVERLFGRRMINGYGMTECAPVSGTRPDRDSPPGSIGWAYPGVEIRLVDRGGQDVGPGNIGELWLRARGMMMGYYRNAEATAATLREGGWLATGDLGFLVPSTGEIVLTGRAKELIIRAGFNVYPAEVEGAINSHPDVLHSAVIGRKVADGDEEVVAFVEPRPGHAVDPEGLDAHLRGIIAPYKRPSRLIVVDALPMGPTGKILKRALADMAAVSPQR
jgi:long-chain acyl-CoA synthetase